MDAQGRSAVLWNSKRQERGSFGVFGRIFEADGQARTAEFHVNQYLPHAQWMPSAAFSRDGTLWAAWESHGQDGSGNGVVARRFDLDGKALGDEIAVNLQREGDQAQVVLAPHGQTDMLAIWASHSSSGDGLLGGLRARRMRADGNHGEEIQVTAEAGDRRPSLAVQGDGYLLSWTRAQTDGSVQAMVQALDSHGKPVAEPVAMAGPQGRDRLEPVVGVDAQGQAYVAWMQQAGETHQVMLQQLSQDAQAQGPARLVAQPQDEWFSGLQLCGTQQGCLVAFNAHHLTETAEGEAKYAREIRIQDFDASLQPSTPRAQTWLRDGNLAHGNAAPRIAVHRDGSLRLAYDGNSGHGDSSAANLALQRKDSAPLPETPEALLQAFDSIDDANMLAANPPIWDPNWVPQGPLARPSAIAGADFGFEAIPGTGWTPPDPELAVGNDRIVVMGNGIISCFNKSGIQLWTDAIENSFGFWGSLGAGGFVFDPECAWDPHSQRFLAMACERTNGRSYFLFAISTSATPTSANAWHKYRLDVTSISGGDIDSPNMAVGPDSILLTADFFSPDKYLIYVLDKASVLSGGSPVTTHELIVGSSQQSMGVPVVFDNDPNLYILQSTEYSSNGSVILHAITNPFTAYSRTTHTLSVPTYQYPAHPPQRGSSSRPYLFEPRFWSVAQRNGSLWAVHHVNATRARVRWYEIALNGWPTSGTPSLAQDGEIDLGDGIYTFFPSIHVDAASNVAISFARSASNEYISFGRALRDANDPPGTMRPAQVVQVSDNAHTSGRWGDYSGTQADPASPGVFWGHHEFTSGSTSSWRTWVAKFVHGPNAVELIPPILISGSSNPLSVKRAKPNARVFFTYSTVGTDLYHVSALNTYLSLDSPVLIGSVMADALGNATLSQYIPPAYAGQTVWIQALQQDMASDWQKVTIQ